MTAAKLESYPRMESSASERPKYKHTRTAHAGRLVLLAIVALIGFTGSFAIAEGKVKDEVISGNTAPLVSGSAVKEAISLCTCYLQTVCKSNGQFVYTVNLQSGSQSQKYNIIRHAGAMYALARAHDFIPDQTTTDALVRAGNFLRTNYIAPDSSSTEKTRVLAVWSEKVGTQEIPQTTLGATGLGLVALSQQKQIAPGSAPLEDLQAMGRFLLFLQKDDGSFYSKYAVTEGGKSDAWESLYYPGETALGFLSLYQLDSSKEWLAAAEKALLYLAKSRLSVKQVPPDCWALIATAKLFAISDETGIPISREPLVHHAGQICESILSEQITNASETRLNGGFDPTGRTTPTSTRLEGLLAALEFLPKDESGLRSRVEKAVHQGIAFLLQSQIHSGPYAGGIPGSVSGTAADGTINPIASKIRIDYVQHALCALIAYQRLFNPVLPQKSER